ncbi:LPXTG cell wall anchor domain-containing protein, partial [Staphylococcus nepalensis]
STSESQSESESLSASESLSESESLSTSESLSDSESLSESESLSTSESISESESLSASESQSESESLSASELRNDYGIFMNNEESINQSQIIPASTLYKNSENDLDKDKKDQEDKLPNTGNESKNNGLIATLAGLSGLALLMRRRKKETDNK